MPAYRNWGNVGPEEVVPHALPAAGRLGCAPMSQIYALLVGIDEYAGTAVPNLTGCGNDVDAVRRILADRKADTLVLRDRAATRAAVIEGLRTHLGRAGSGDTALFWFSGHGSEEPVPDWAWFEEPTGMLQTLVCADSRIGPVPDLWDKEISALLDRVAQRAGHVVAVLDSCHSDGATREIGVRFVEPPGSSRRRDSLVPEVAAAGPDREHVAIAACRRDQSAVERRLGGVRHGLFTWALLRMLERLGPRVSYRRLLVAVRTEIARRGGAQVPELYPAGARHLLDQPFLGGDPERSQAPAVMSYGPDGWQVDIGAAHGLPARPDGIRLAVAGSEPPRTAAATRVLPERSLVRPLGGWQPAADQQFPVVLTGLPEPATRIRVDDRALLPADPAVCEGEPAQLIARIRDGAVSITGEDGREIVSASPRQAPRLLSHLGRWLRIWRLSNPFATLNDPVVIEVVEAGPGVDRVPEQGQLLVPGPDRAYHLRDGQEIFIRLRNNTDRELYCVLLDLAGDYSVSADLFPGAPIGPGCAGAALRGRRVLVTIPGGAQATRDRLVLVVAEKQISADPYLLPPLRDEDAARTLTAATVDSAWTTVTADIVVDAF